MADFNPNDPLPSTEQLLKAISDLEITNKEMLDNLKQVHGSAYAMHVQAVSDILNVLRTTNTMICGKWPGFMVKAVSDLQIQRATALVYTFMLMRIPGDSPEQEAKRIAATDEMIKNITALTDQRVNTEKKLNGVILPAGKFRKDGEL